MNKNDILNYEVLDTASRGTTISGTAVATEFVAVIPNAIAAPFQRYHEVEVKKEIAIKMLEHQSQERDKLCDLMLGLAQLDMLDSEKFQTIMVAYGMKRF